MTTPPDTTLRNPSAPSSVEVRDVGRIPIDTPPRSKLGHALRSPAAKWVAIITALGGLFTGVVAAVTPLVKLWADSDNAKALAELTKRTEALEARAKALELANEGLAARVAKAGDQTRALRTQTWGRLLFLEGATCELGITRLDGFCALDFYPRPKNLALPRVARSVQVERWEALPE